MTAAVSVLVPYRGSPERDPLWKYVQAWWEEKHPGWQVLEGACQPGPWIKAAAVADALSRADGDILVVSDADVLCDGVADAVRVAAAHPDRWAVPHRRVHRLTEEATTAVLAGGPLPEPTRGRAATHTPYQPRPAVYRPKTGPIYESYAGVEGGGLVVLSRALYDRVPMDPRFHNYGQEDSSWGRALTVLSGSKPWRAPADLFHLFHPPAPRMPRSRSVGSVESAALYRRYRAATAPAQMAALIAEFHTVAA